LTYQWGTAHPWKKKAEVIRRLLLLFLRKKVGIVIIDGKVKIFLKEYLTLKIM
jgi:hypothetical protein